MRLRAATGLLLLALAGCAHLPGRVAVEVDDNRIEAGKKDGR